MLLNWLKWNIDTMGWFFELKLSDPTLDVFTQLMERKMRKDRPIELIVNR
jgi:hypothetical protein